MPGEKRWSCACLPMALALLRRIVARLCDGGSPVAPKSRFVVLTVGCLVTASLFLPADAAAQRRGGSPSGGRPVAVARPVYSRPTTIVRLLSSRLLLSAVLAVLLLRPVHLGLGRIRLPLQLRNRLWLWLRVRLPVSRALSLSLLLGWRLRPDRCRPSPGHAQGDPGVRRRLLRGPGRRVRWRAAAAARRRG